MGRHRSLILGRGIFGAAAMAAGLLNSAEALELPQKGDFRGSFDTTISYGATFRAEEPDSRLIAISNGGESGNINGDDGNLNYNQSEAVYNAVKVSHELDLDYGRFGAFVRGSYYYDFANVTRESLGDQARKRTGHYAEFLDAYVHGTFPVFNNTLSLRLGQQVVNWGESSFIQNGIAVINPVDVAKLRVPGSELKEGLMPTPMAHASQTLGRFFTLEGFVLSDFDHVRTDPRGTFFATDDIVSDGGDAIYTGGGRRFDQHLPPTVTNLSPSAPGQVFGTRGPDREASDGGQAGIALRVLAPALNNTEFGFYHMNYHSRVPFISGVRGGVSLANPASFGCGGGTPYVNLPGLGPGPGPNCTDTPATYHVEYPENIRLYGVSFNTPGPWGWAIQGEHSYRPNQPVQYTVAEVAFTAGGLQTFLSENALAAATRPFGEEIKGYRRMDVHQSQMSLTKVLGPVLGIDVLTLVGEAGYTHMNLPEGEFFNGPAASVAPGTNAGTGVSTAPIQGAATKDSWGYRLLMRMDFLNVFQTNMAPRVSFAHDVKGTSPTFVEGVKALSFGWTTSFRSSWALDLSYTSYFGGREISAVTSGPIPAGQPAEIKNLTNSLADRDFYSVSVSYAF